MSKNPAFDRSRSSKAVIVAVGNGFVLEWHNHGFVETADRVYRTLQAAAVMADSCSASEIEFNGVVQKL